MELSSTAPVYSRLNPFPATLIENRLLSGACSAKEVRHIVLDLSGSGLSYRVGQSLGVYPTNDPEAVGAILNAGGWSGKEPVMLPKIAEPVALGEALLKYLHLGEPTRKTLEALLAMVTHPDERAMLMTLLEPQHTEAAQKFLAERFFVDLMEEFSSAHLTPQQLAGLMKKLQPRMYSIASSPKVGGNMVDLTVAVTRYVTNGRPRAGVASSFLADRVPLGGRAPIFVSETPFNIADDDAAPMIMVGPGTGIAPFRGFLQERDARKATGKNWIFFGEQHRKCDFLYEGDFIAAQKSGLLTKLDLAWSRDQDKKVYVQDLMRQNAIDIWTWIHQGSYFYVCGDAKKMAKDVDTALHEIISMEGKMDAAQAAEFVSQMKKSGRYMRDVY